MHRRSSTESRLWIAFAFVLTLLATTPPVRGVTNSQAPGTFDRLAAQAAKASEENRLDDAVTLYRKALALRPRWAEGWWSLGTLQYDRNQYREAAHAFQKLLALKPDNGTAHGLLGLCQVELKQDDAALKNLTLAQQLGVQNDRGLQQVVLFQLASVQLRLHRFGDASSNFVLLVANHQARSAPVSLGMGMAVLKISPDLLTPEGSPARDLVQRVGEAEVLAAVKQFDAAKSLYELAANQYPAYPNLHHAFGRCLLAAHETDEAVQEFQKELQNNPRHLGALLQLAAVRYRVDSADGVQYAERALRVDPQLPFAHYLLGLLYLDTDRADEAVPHLEIARKAFPAQAQMYFALGTAYAKVGRKEEAARMRAEFVRLNVGKAKEPAPDVYGEQPSGILNQKLQEQNAQAPKP